MTDETGAPAGGDAIAVVQAPADTGADLSISQAARALAAARHKPKEESAPVEQPQADPVEQPELAQANADPETAPSEEPDAADPQTPEPIEPPRSWTKAEKERFQSLPRETQEYLHAREQERERDFRRSQNEIAEQRKAIEAERQKAEQVRQQYEAQLPGVMQALQDAQNGAFADIRTVDDVTKLANEDPFRYLQWQAHQTKLQAVNAELERAKDEKSKAEQSEWANHVQKENALAAEYIPELADKDKGPKLTQRVATELLPELGFKDSELADLASGKSKLSIYDHRVQRLLADAVKLRDIQSAKTAVVAKPLPPVQKPGTARPQGNAHSEQIQALTRKLNETGDLRVAQQLRALQAKRRAS
ncbi:hypothetical protein V1290_000046 [Bradyrhizobium sp. AZCC 1578]|uniref:hypothetical protein n=1 Tax=Bradyrhizobium sp. AZCC 1578 TaxID=3117027 RepID=UPI002FEFB8A5